MAVSTHHREAVSLGVLLAGLTDATVHSEWPVSSIAVDSRQVENGAVFMACQGANTHGAHFIPMAVQHGAALILLEPGSSFEPESISIPVLEVEQLQHKVGIIAERFFGQPSSSLDVIGVTGTNGKTSVSHFIAQALSEDTACGLLGTLGNGLYGQTTTALNTTPDPVSLHQRLADFVQAGAPYCAMEVSSHGLEQGRVAGVDFKVAVYTNLSHEHLDYHGTMTQYAAAKRRLLDWPSLRALVLNVDDEYGRQWRSSLNPGLDIFDYSLEPGSTARLRGRVMRMHGAGMEMQIETSEGKYTLRSGLLGHFNAANLLAALGALLACGMDMEVAIARLEKMNTVPGRMELFTAPDKPAVVVDYAHTPDALENVLAALQEHCEGTLWCVFGCGGERDRAKRPLMGRIAEQMAPRVVITDDNPRREDALGIIEDILTGFHDAGRVYIQRDRKQAIAHALENASARDVVLVAGKGHEDYQEVGGVRTPYSDRQWVQHCLHGEVGHG